MAKAKKYDPNNPPYKVMKVYDCQDMPEKIKRAFFDVVEEWGIPLAHNDTCVEWNMGEMLGGIESMAYNETMHENMMKVNNYLLVNGVTETSDDILIKHWW